MHALAAAGGIAISVSPHHALVKGRSAGVAPRLEARPMPKVNGYSSAPASGGPNGHSRFGTPRVI